MDRTDIYDLFRTAVRRGGRLTQKAALPVCARPSITDIMER